MRKKELKLVITFHTTADAMAMEKECKKVGAQGRMIPVPRSISAGCGLSWCAPLECREELKNVMQGIGLEATSANSLSGKGDAAANNVFTGTITVTVIEVLPTRTMSA